MLLQQYVQYFKAWFLKNIKLIFKRKQGKHVVTLHWNIQGRVITETTTEYQEIDDDSNFEGPTLTSSITSGFFETKPTTTEPKKSVRKESSSSSSDDDKETSADDFEKEALKLHNEYRKKHGSPPLKLCKKVPIY